MTFSGDIRTLAQGRLTKTLTMTSHPENSNFNTPQIEHAPSLEPTDSVSKETHFTQPAAGRIITGAGLAGSQLQQVLRQHDAVQPRVTPSQRVVSVVRAWLKLRRRA